MADKVQKIKEWISKTQDGLMDAQGNFEYPEHEGAYHILCNLDAYIDSLQEEPVSDELEKVVEEIVDPTVLNAYGVKEIANRLRRTMIEPVSEELEKAAEEYIKYTPRYDIEYELEEGNDPTEIECFTIDETTAAFIAAALWQREHLWKSAEGSNLPIFDREVIVLTQPYPLKGSEYAVYFAHRPDPKGWDGKSVTTGKVEHYTPKTYDKGGWNIPDVKFWLDVELPKEIEL